MQVSRPNKINPLASKFVGVSLRMSRIQDKGISIAIMTPNQILGEISTPVSKKKDVCKFCGTNIK